MSTNSDGFKKKKANYTKNKLTNQSGRSIVRNMKKGFTKIVIKKICDSGRCISWMLFRWKYRYNIQEKLKKQRYTRYNHFYFWKTWKRFHNKAANYVQTNFHKLQNRRNATWKEKWAKRQQLFRLSPVERIEHGRLFATTKHFFWCVCRQSSFLSCLTIAHCRAYGLHSRVTIFGMVFLEALL